MKVHISVIFIDNVHKLTQSCATIRCHQRLPIACFECLFRISAVAKLYDCAIPEDVYIAGTLEDRFEVVTSKWRFCVRLRFDGIANVVWQSGRHFISKQFSFLEAISRIVGFAVNITFDVDASRDTVRMFEHNYINDVLDHLQAFL